MNAQLPIALDLDTFLNLPIEERPPLLGTTEDALIAAGGLVLLGGKAGLGKTTLIVDLIFHLAAGLNWLTFPAIRPLNILVIENEGPMRMFQQKLADKKAVWTHDLQAEIHVQTMAWGWFSFADSELHGQLANYLDEHHVDLVIGDPIGTLGMQGVGSPEDTRNFVQKLLPLGLMEHRAFIFPVHFTKEPRLDEVDQISGAWGGHLDTLMVLKSAGRKDELRLSFPKLRWWKNQPPAPIILGKVRNTQSFEIIRHEGDEQEQPLEERIVALLDDGVWRTAPEIAHRETGVRARRQDVQKTLNARPDLFRWESGADHQKSAKAVVWQLVPQTGTTQPHKPAPLSQKHSSHTNGTSRDESDESEGAEPLFSLVPRPWDEWDELEPEHSDAVLDYSSPTLLPVGEGGTSHQASGQIKSSRPLGRVPAGETP